MNSDDIILHRKPLPSVSFRRIRDSRRMMSPTGLSFFLLSLLFSPVQAFVHAGNESYPSLPGLFGRPMALGQLYPGRLQFLRESPYLCPTNSDDGQLLNVNDTSLVIPTNDNLPIMLLVARGQCTFQQKALVAESLHPSVQYLIVYNSIAGSASSDNSNAQDSTDDSSIVPMYSEFGETRLVLLSVSHASGQALKRFLRDQPNKEVYRQGGPRIYVNSLPPLSNNSLLELTVDDLRDLLLTVLVLFFGLIAVSACLLVAAGRYGQVYVSGHRILLTTTTTNAAGEAPGSASVLHHYSIGAGGGRGLLTEGQVRQLAKDQASVTREHLERLRPETTLQREHDTAVTAAEEQEHTCAICIDNLFDVSSSARADGPLPSSNMDDSDASLRLLTLPCHHTFHVDCIVPWLTERQAKCPLCKYSVLEYVWQKDLERQQQQQRDDNDVDPESDGSSPPRPTIRRSLLQFLFLGRRYTAVQQPNDVEMVHQGGGAVAATDRQEAVHELERATADLRRQVDGYLA
jgi:hypothetical protein